MGKKRKCLRNTVALEAEIQAIWSSDIVDTDWKLWQPQAGETQSQWLNLYIGIKGDEAVDYFQVQVTTYEALKDRRQKRPFRGFVRPTYDPDLFEQDIYDFVAQVKGRDRQEVMTNLCEKFFWEFENMG